MNPVMTRPSPVPVRSARSIAFVIAAIVVTLLAIVAVTFGTRPPGMVDGVTIENPTSLPVHVSVSAGPGESTLGLGVVSPGGAATFDAVLDPGSEWTFHFGSGQARGGELTVSRDELAADDWSAMIPEDVAERLADDGAAPSSG